MQLSVPDPELYILERRQTSKPLNMQLNKPMTLITYVIGKNSKNTEIMLSMMCRVKTNIKTESQILILETRDRGGFASNIKMPIKFKKKLSTSISGD